MVFNFDVRAIWHSGQYDAEPLIARLPVRNVGCKGLIKQSLTGEIAEADQVFAAVGHFVCGDRRRRSAGGRVDHRRGASRVHAD